MHLIGVLLLLTFVSSCGKSNSSAGIPVAKEKILPLDGSNIAGLYMAKFETLNAQINGSIPGSATLQRQDNKFFAYVRLFGGAPNAWHQQNIYEGKRCPNFNDDINKDGYIDVEEGRKVWGNVLIPLDSNINSQYAGRNIYPVGDATGTYFYERTSNFDDMFEDLREEDKNLNDNIAKLPEDKGLDFEGRVVVVHGTAPSVIYPPSVSTTERHTQQQTLPIACGVFSKINRIPGEMDTDEIPPGPVEPPQEGTPVPGEEPIPGEPVPVPGEPIPGEPIPDTTNPAPTEPPQDPYPETQPRRPDPDSNRNEDDEWYDRVRDWWRERWETSRGNRRTNWGDGWTFRL